VGLDWLLTRGLVHRKGITMTIEQRLDQLAAANRRWRFLAGVLGLMVASGLLMAQTGAGRVPEVVRTRKLEVVNAQGVAVVTLDAWERGGRILAMSNDGHLLFEAAAGSVNIYNFKGQKLVRLSATKDGEGLMATYNHNGEGVVAVGATKDGEGAFTTYNGAGQKLVSLSATDGGGAISVWNQTGQAIATMRTDGEGRGEVGAWNTEGQGRTLTPGR